MPRHSSQASFCRSMVDTQLPRMFVKGKGDFMTTTLLIHDMAVDALPDDDRLWVPQAPSVWFRPLLLNTVNGEWVNLLRVKRAGVLSRHRHPAPVHGYVIRGSWRYLEHDWIAREGMYVFEPP